MFYRGGSKLAIKFRLWFFLTLLPTFVFLFYFSKVFLFDRRVLIGETLRENQFSQVLSIEEFFRNRFTSSHIKVQEHLFNQLAQAYDQEFEKLSLTDDRSQSAKSLTSSFHKEFFPEMGFRIPPGLDEAAKRAYVNQLFCKFQVADLKTFNDQSNSRYPSNLETIRDFYDLVGSLAMRLLDHSDLDSSHSNPLRCSPANALKSDPKSIDRDCLSWLMAQEIQNLKKYIELREKLLFEGKDDDLLDAEELRQIYRPIKFLETHSQVSVGEFKEYVSGHQLKIQKLMSQAREAYEINLSQHAAKNRQAKMSDSQNLEECLKALEQFAYETFSDAWLGGRNWDQLGRPPIYFLKEFGDRVFTDQWGKIFANSFSLVNFRFDLLDHFKRKSSKFELEIGNSFLSPQLLLDGYRPLMEPDDIDWKMVVRLLMHLVKFSLAGDFYLDEQSRLSAFAIVSTADLKRTRNHLLSISVAMGKIAFLWDLIPRNYFIDDFVAGLAPPPRGLLTILFRQHDFIFHYVRLFQAVSRLSDGDKKIFFTSLNAEYAKLQLDGEDLIPDFGNAHSELKAMLEEMNERWGGARANSSFPSFFDFFLHEIGFNDRYTVWRKNSWQANTKIKILPTAKVFQAQSFQENDFVEQKILREVGQALSIEAIKRWLEDPSEVLSFEYIDGEGKDRFANLVSSVDLPGFIFFLSIDSATAFREINYSIMLLLSICTVAILISLALGATISKIVVNPINMLREEVRMYGGSSNRKPLVFHRFDELGKMIKLFNAMVGSIDQRVSELKAVSEVNSLLLKGKKLTELMTFVGQRFTQLTGAKIGFIGFLDQDSSERLLASYLHGVEKPTPNDSLEQELLEVAVGRLESISCPEFLHQLTERVPIATAHKTLHFQSIQPALRGLHELRDVLKDLNEDQEECVEQSEHKLKGFIILLDCDKKLLSEEKLEFLKEFGNQAATVILKAYLDQTRDETIEGQLVQESLMPAEPPRGQERLDVAFSFIAAKYLGGDFFDFPSPNEGEVGFFISDVSGKGVGPALFGATSKAYLKLLSGSFEDTGTTLLKMNEYLCQLGYEHLFATAFYLIIDLKTLQAQYSSAGHNRMILIRSNSDTIEYLNAKGLVLGMFTPCRFETKELLLEAGDLLILYTDGITEFENPELELYGNERFESVLLANRYLDSESLKRKVLDDLLEFGRSQVQSDDITLIIMKIRP